MRMQCLYSCVAVLHCSVKLAVLRQDPCTAALQCIAIQSGSAILRCTAIKEKAAQSQLNA